MQKNKELDLLIKEADKKKLKGEHLDAIKICEKALAEDLNCTEAYEEIGDNYLSLRQYEKAKKALERAIKLDPHSANANYLLGFVYSAIGDWKKSINYLRCLGWSIFHDGQRKRGVILLERALALAPSDPLILSDLGVCHLNDKNFERSSVLFKKVLEIEPDNEKARECLNAVRFFQKEFKRFREKHVG